MREPNEKIEIDHPVFGWFAQAVRAGAKAL